MNIGFVKLIWNDSLASDSVDFATTCSTEHSGVPHENLAWGSPFINAFDAVTLWLNEKYGGPVIGHYLQMTHIMNRQIGCGRAVCGENWYMYVCRYKRIRPFKSIWAWNSSVTKTGVNKIFPYDN
jgi:hypothetical protein